MGWFARLAFPGVFFCECWTRRRMIGPIHTFDALVLDQAISGYFHNASLGFVRAKAEGR